MVETENGDIQFHSTEPKFERGQYFILNSRNNGERIFRVVFRYLVCGDEKWRYIASVNKYDATAKYRVENLSQQVLRTRSSAFEVRRFQDDNSAKKYTATVLGLSLDSLQEFTEDKLSQHLQPNYPQIEE